MNATSAFVSSASPSNPSNWDEKMRDYERREEEVRPASRQAIFDALERAGITQVKVHFDGYGDSGQIEDIEATEGENSRDLPSVEIEFTVAVWDQPGFSKETRPLRQALEAMAYDLLGKTHGGWENNEGAYGDFVFDVADRSITLDYHERYISCEQYTHEF